MLGTVYCSCLSRLKSMIVCDFSVHSGDAAPMSITSNCTRHECVDIGWNVHPSNDRFYFMHRCELSTCRFVEVLEVYINHEGATVQF